MTETRIQVARRLIEPPASRGSIELPRARTLDRPHENRTSRSTPFRWVRRGSIVTAALTLTLHAAHAQSTDESSLLEAESGAVATTPEEPIDVTVREPPQPADTTRVTRAEAREMPGAFGDAFRAVEQSPSVIPLASGVPYFFLRGAPPGNVGYLLDGIRVPLLFHLGLGPSVIHPALMDSVELRPGPSAEFGRYSAGVVAGTLTTPRDDVRAEGHVRLVDLGGFVEVPFDEGRGHVFGAGRFSYTALLFSLANVGLALNYWDYAAGARYEVTPGQTVRMFAFGAYDYLAEQSEVGPDVRLFDTMFHRINGGYDAVISPNTRLRTDVTWGWDQTHLGETQDVTDQMLSVRSHLEHRVSDALLWIGGVDFTADSYDVALDSEETSEEFARFFRSRDDIAIGGFLALEAALGGGLSIRPALRADVYHSGGHSALGVEPQLRARLQIHDLLALVASQGLAAQPPSFIVAGPGFRPPLDEQGLQWVWSQTYGAELRPVAEWLFKATAYHSAMFDMNDALGTSGLTGEGFPDGIGDFANRVDGSAYGLELSAQRRLIGPIGAAFTYAIGRSQRRTEKGVAPSSFDRTHVASAALTFDFGAGFRGGTRQVFYTGTPVARVDARGDEVLGRLPPFYRFDFRVEKRFRLGARGQLAIVAEMLNTFLADEVLAERCNSNGRCSPSAFGPVSIPSVGVEASY